MIPVPAGGARRTLRDRLLLVDRISTTRIVLARLRLGLLGGIVVMLLAAFFGFGAAHDTVTTASGRTAIALMDISVAQQALIQADANMVQGLAGSTVARNDQSTLYRDDLALASQSLQGVGEFDDVGNGAILELQQVESQITVYSGLSEQAYVDSASNEHLGFVEVVYASTLMHSGGILSTLGSLFNLEQKQFDSQLSSGWLAPPAALLWALPVVALLVVLVFTQVFLARRFGRTLNGYLLAATALLVALSVCVGVVTAVEASRLDAAHSAIGTVLADRQVTSGALPKTAGSWQVAVLDGLCDQHARVGCGAARPPAGITTTRQDTDATNATASALAAPNAYGLPYLIPLFGLLIMLLIWFGIHVRIREYRYEAR